MIFSQLQQLPRDPVWPGLRTSPVESQFCAWPAPVRSLSGGPSGLSSRQRSFTTDHRKPVHQSPYGPLVTQDEMTALLSPQCPGNPNSMPVLLPNEVEGVCVVSHDMRSPVASILALGQQMLREEGSNTLAVQHVMRHAEQLLAMMDDVMTHTQARNSTLLQPGV